MSIQKTFEIFFTKSITNCALPLTCLILLISTTGCGPGVPPIAEVTGKVTIDGDPLPHAKVEFYPMHDGLDGNYMASGVTDEQGNYALAHKGGSTPGVTACLCKVTISEGPVPDNIRAMGQAGAAKLKSFRKKLKNRPIPSSYGTLGTTTLEVTVDKDDPVNDFELGE